MVNYDKMNVLGKRRQTAKLERTCNNCMFAEQCTLYGNDAYDKKTNSCYQWKLGKDTISI